MTTISIEIEGLGPVLNRIGRLATWKVGLHRQIGALLKQQHEDRINNEKESPDGVPWAPLKASTIAKKTRSGNQGPPDNILQDTWNMSRGFRVDEHGDLIRLTNPTSDRGKRYIFFHQEGTIFMEARPVMGLSAPNVQGIRRLVERHVASRLLGGI